MSVAAVNADTAVAFSTPDGHVSFFTPRRATSLEEVVPMAMASPRLVSRTNIREWFSGDSPLHPFGGGQHADERRRDAGGEQLIAKVWQSYDSVLPLALLAGGSVDEKLFL